MPVPFRRLLRGVLPVLAMACAAPTLHAQSSSPAIAA